MHYIMLGHRGHQTQLYAMSTEAEGKAAYEAARKDLTNALTKRKEIDKQLVSLFP